MLSTKIIYIDELQSLSFSTHVGNANEKWKRYGISINNLLTVNYRWLSTFFRWLFKVVKRTCNTFIYFDCSLHGQWAFKEPFWNDCLALNDSSSRVLERNIVSRMKYYILQTFSKWFFILTLFEPVKKYANLSNEDFLQSFDNRKSKLAPAMVLQ